LTEPADAHIVAEAGETAFHIYAFARKAALTAMVAPGFSEVLRHAFRHYAATVTFLTYLDTDGRSCGMTATSVCSLSLEPPRLLACVNRTTKTHGEISSRGSFAVNILAARQRRTAMECSAPGSDKTLDARLLLTEEASGCTNPILKDSLACLDCQVVETHEAATHTIFIGEMTAAWLNPADEWPLVYFGGFYRRLESEIAEAERFHWEI
jgi:flavin reductase (DIM6/NTAB) family NADH-FMN oxidoreductase RutF